MGSDSVVQEGQEGSVRLLKGDAHGLVVHSLDLVHQLKAGLGFRVALIGPDHVVHGDGISVGEGGAVAQVEGVGAVVIGDFIALRKIRGHGAVVLQDEKAVIDVEQDALRVRRDRDEGIEAVRLGLDHDGGFSAFLDAACRLGLFRFGLRGLGCLGRCRCCLGRCRSGLRRLLSAARQGCRRQGRRKNCRRTLSEHALSHFHFLLVSHSVFTP